MELLESVSGVFSNDIAQGMGYPLPAGTANGGACGADWRGSDERPSEPAMGESDCGLKTRDYTETEQTLRNLVEATTTVRAGL